MLQSEPAATRLVVSPFEGHKNHDRKHIVDHMICHTTARAASFATGVAVNRGFFRGEGLRNRPQIETTCYLVKIAKVVDFTMKEAFPFPATCGTKFADVETSAENVASRCGRPAKRRSGSRGGGRSSGTG